MGVMPVWARASCCAFIVIVLNKFTTWAERITHLLFSCYFNLKLSQHHPPGKKPSISSMDARMSDLATEKYLSERENLLAIARSLVKDHALAEDLVQESWFRWIGASYPLDRSGPILKKIVSNLCIDWHRRQARERKRDTEFLRASAHDYAPATEHVVVARQQLRLVARALAKQPQQHVMALRLYCIDGLTYRDIGEKLGVSHVSAFKMVARSLACAAEVLDT